jgi:hypothetical protein
MKWYFAFPAMLLSRSGLQMDTHDPVTVLLVYAFGTCEMCKVSHVSIQGNDRSVRDKCVLQGAIADINAIQAG